MTRRSAWLILAGCVFIVASGFLPWMRRDVIPLVPEAPPRSSAVVGPNSLTDAGSIACLVLALVLPWVLLVLSGLTVVLRGRSFVPLSLVCVAAVAGLVFTAFLACYFYVLAYSGLFTLTRGPALSTRIISPGVGFWSALGGTSRRSAVAQCSTSAGRTQRRGAPRVAGLVRVPRRPEGAAALITIQDGIRRLRRVNSEGIVHHGTEMAPSGEWPCLRQVLETERMRQTASAPAALRTDVRRACSAWGDFSTRWTHATGYSHNPSPTAAECVVEECGSGRADAVDAVIAACDKKSGYAKRWDRALVPDPTVCCD